MDYLLPGIPVTVALAAVALFGYLFGRRNSGDKETNVSELARRELRRAAVVAKELEAIAEALRMELATHHTSVARFRERVNAIQRDRPEEIWGELCKEAEQVLKPTIRLASQLAQAYDEIRQQSSHLMSFTEVRTDPLTGVSNRRALEESMQMLFALRTRYNRPFSVAIFDLDHFKKINDEHGHMHGDGILRQVAQLFDETVRETDVVARYGGEEFVVVMPQTELAGAAIFTERMRHIIETTTKLTVSGGVAEASDRDDGPSLLARADVALYGAKAAGRNLVFLHNGDDIAKVDKEEYPEDEVPGALKAPEPECLLAGAPTAAKS